LRKVLHHIINFVSTIKTEGSIDMKYCVEEFNFELLMGEFYMGVMEGVKKD